VSDFDYDRVVTRWTKGSGARLLQAVVELSTAEPIHEISVAALCQAAGVTRDTFYRYATRPIDVLAEAMSRDLPHTAELVAQLTRAPAANPLEIPGRMILQHVERNLQVYRNALRPHLDSALRDVLIARILDLLAAFVERCPEVVPRIEGSPPCAAEVRQMVIFTASGIVGAIEHWACQDTGGATGADRMLSVLFASAASWWHPDSAASPGVGRRDHDLGRPAIAAPDTDNGCMPPRPCG
jgi:AcrR family transcriptional regulator